MVVRERVKELWKRTMTLLPMTEEEVLLRGITTGITERIIELRRAVLDLQQRCGSLNKLEERIEREGISPDDHTPYVDLLEWQAIKHELTQLTKLLEEV